MISLSPLLLVLIGGVSLLVPMTRQQLLSGMPDWGVIVRVVAFAVAICLGSAAAAYFAIRRAKRIAAVIDEGVPVTGTLTEVSFNLRKQTGQVVYRYTYQDTDYESWAAVFRNIGSKNLEPGDPVDLVLDPERPTVAFIKAMYVE
ncbi:MAG: DUF3592 domain-containing protein [Planctomycetia bacterium]|nr:DUF3592 domain-containing protein [Planctomycetia bacterium]